MTRPLLPGRNAHDSAQHWGAARLGAVPALGPRDLARLPPDERNPLRFLTEFPSSAYANVLRHACWDVLDSGARRIVAVSSPQRQEGASNAALALAAISASQNRKTVLVDCDLRARTATLALGQDPARGVWEVSRGDMALEAALIACAPFGFWLLPAARAQNAYGDLYSGQAAQQFLAALRQAFDCVVLDLPPVFVTVDAAIMARAADACMLVVRRHRTDAAKARRAFLRLRSRAQIPVALLQNFAPVARIGS